jgi:putative colanic acid biosynthesis acetyltransferase WcaB
MPSPVGSIAARKLPPMGSEGMDATADIRTSNFKTWVLQDWEANRGVADSQFILLSFRTAQWGVHRLPKGPGRLVGLAWIVLSRVLGIDIPPSTEIGPRLHLWHYFGIVVHPKSRLGPDCHLRHGVTIGNKGSARETEVPVIGQGVDFGAYSAVIGPITVGDRTKLGTHTVLTKSVPAGSVVVGNPGVVIRVDEEPRS